MSNYTIGKHKVLYIKKDTVFYRIGYLTTNSFNESADMLGTTTRENTDGWQSSIPTLQSYTITFNALITIDNGGESFISHYELLMLKRDRTLIEWQIYNSEGIYIETGKGYITSIGETDTVEDLISFDGKIIGYGKPEIATGTVPPQNELEDMLPYYEAAKQN